MQEIEHKIEAKVFHNEYTNTAELEFEDEDSKRRELEELITTNSCLIDILKDACEYNIELDYIMLIHSALTVISEKQMKALKIVSELC